MSSDHEGRNGSPGEESDESGSVDSRSDHGDHKRGSRSRSHSYQSDKGKYRGRSRTRSRSRSRGHHKRRYSYSRSRSRSYHKRSRSRSRSPYYKRSSRYSRSRSRSPYRDSRNNYGSRRSGHGRSYSRSPPRYRGGGRRYKDTSPMSNRRRHVGNRDKPEPTKCLGVFGLSLYTQERDLRDVYSRFGPIEECNVVYDRQSGRSRGFAFVYFKNLEDSIEAKDRSAGTEIDGRRIRVDYSITERAHTPTPGIYLGKPTTPPRERGYSGGGGSGGGGGRYRSPSPYYRRSSRYSRSRSRSYSPRRY